MTKVCTKCKIEKDLSEFHNRSIKNGYKQSKCKECFTIHGKKRWARIKNNNILYLKNRKWQRDWVINNQDKVIVSRAKRRAKEKQLPFSITYKDIVIPDVCPILGIPLLYNGEKMTPNSPSLDAIVPEKGYVKGNIQVISVRANAMKNDASKEELIKFAKWITTFYGT